jgi:plasmid stabilization system protein ParE
VNQKIVLLPQAKKELRNAFQWYEAQEKGLGHEFLISTNAAKASLERTPEMYPKVFKEVRRAQVRRFPFSIYYVSRTEVIYILSVFHARRNPDQWKKRLP